MKTFKDELKEQLGGRFFLATTLSQIAPNLFKSTIKGLRNGFELARRLTERLKMKARYKYYWNECIRRDGKYCLEHARQGIFHLGEEIDHVISLKNNGWTGEDNHQLLCRESNRRKGSKSIDFRPKYA